MVSSSTEENRHLQKQTGCINGVFQLLHRRHFLAGRSMSSHHLFPGAQQQLEAHNARKTVIEKDVGAQKMEPRVSLESSQAATSSSSSSTLSSLYYNRQINTRKDPFQVTAIKEEKHLLTNGPQSPDIRDVVKESVYMDARCVLIKTSVNDERKVKHVNSSRPVQQSKFGKPKASVYEGTNKSKVVGLALPRLSYDGRESRDAFKTNIKLKELPRFSLDSNSRLNFLGRDENDNSSQVPPANQKSGSHSRSNSIIAKLMGLDAFPDSITKDESLLTKTNSGLSPSFRVSHHLSESSKKDSSLPLVRQKNPSSPSPRLHNATFVKNQYLRFPFEPAPCKQPESPEMATQSGRGRTNSRHQSSSVYGEIEERIAEIEFNRSGKDLRALKQVLETMKKTRERLENQRGESAEPEMQEKSILRKETPHLQNLQNQDPEYQKENSRQKEKARYRTPRINTMKEANQRLPSIGKKISRREIEERTLKAPQRLQVENSTTTTKGFGMVSPRVRYIVVRTEKESHPNRSTSESGRAKQQTSKKVREKCHKNRKQRVKSTKSHLSDQLSSISSETRYYHGDMTSTKSESNNSITSHVEAEVIISANYISTNPREQQDSVTTSKEHTPTMKLAVAMMEQPSPVSVLDNPFYVEGSPSPVKKISTVFREDESTSLYEAEWHLENLKHLTDCTKSNSCYRYNQKPENQLHFIHESRLLKTEANETAIDHIKSAYQGINPGHRCHAKILLASGDCKDISITQTADRLHLPCHLIKSDTFNSLEATEDLMEEAMGELIKKNDQTMLNQRIQEKIVPDLMNEIMVRKMTSGGLFNLGSKRMSLQGIIKEVYLEMDHLCQLPYCDHDDEDEDGSIRLLTADMKYQSDDWRDYSGEVPSLVFNIERLIFKDMINEVITNEVSMISKRGIASNSLSSSISSRIFLTS